MAIKATSARKSPLLSVLLLSLEEPMHAIFVRKMSVRSKRHLLQIVKQRFLCTRRHSLPEPAEPLPSRSRWYVPSRFRERRSPKPGAQKNVHHSALVSKTASVYLPGARK